MRRLAVFSHKLFRRTSKELQTTGGFTIQMDALASHFEQVILCVPTVDDAGFHGVGVTAPNVNFHPLPNYRGGLCFLGAVPLIRREILAVMGNADVALAIMPGYVGALASMLCQGHQFPLFQWIVGNWGRNVEVARHAPLARWWASTVWAPLLDRLVARLTRDVLTFYNGRILYDQGKPYHFTRVSSSIRQDDFYICDDISPLVSPYRVLFVGRLSPEKGIPHLLEATALLVKEGEAVELHIVGAGPLEAELWHQARALSIPDQVHFHGFVSQGEALRRLYRESDAFVLPSVEDQQPKVLMEAMTQSLPVIATDVGGIPSIIRDGENGLLVPAAQLDALAAAIRRVLSDDVLREKLIAGGLEFAKLHTVEHETAQMMSIVAWHFG